MGHAGHLLLQSALALAAPVARARVSRLRRLVALAGARPPRISAVRRRCTWRCWSGGVSSSPRTTGRGGPRSRSCRAPTSRATTCASPACGISPIAAWTISTCATRSARSRFPICRRWIFIVSYWHDGPVGHTFLSFCFDNAPPVCISIETRPEVGEGFDPIASLFKQFELIYLVGDEHDLVGLRVIHRDEDVFLYRIHTSPEHAQELFRIYLQPHQRAGRARRVVSPAEQQLHHQHHPLREQDCAASVQHPPFPQRLHRSLRLRHRRDPDGPALRRTAPAIPSQRSGEEGIRRARFFRSHPRARADHQSVAVFRTTKRGRVEGRRSRVEGQQIPARNPSSSTLGGLGFLGGYFIYRKR